jgi:hypothetical protein
MSDRQFTDEDLKRIRAQYAASPEEIAAVAGISRSAFYRHHYAYVRSGRIQSLRVGGCLRIIVASYLAFLETEAQHGT